jgi:phospholipid/cholesterol/gamma-HCH transport system permease protein
MQVTEQVDAIKTLGVNPVGYYFAPRLIASAITVPMVVVLAEFIGIVGGMMVAYFAIQLHPNRFMNTVWLLLQEKDIYISIFKAFVFGVLITLVCATQGYKTSGGAKDVGISTTKSAIQATFALLIADFIINLLFYVNISF